MGGAYCTTCDWQDTAVESTALDRAMLEHFRETGHAVERADIERGGSGDHGRFGTAETSGTGTAPGAGAFGGRFPVLGRLEWTEEH